MAIASGSNGNAERQNRPPRHGCEGTHKREIYFWQPMELSFHQYPILIGFAFAYSARFDSGLIAPIFAVGATVAPQPFGPTGDIRFMSWPFSASSSPLDVYSWEKPLTRYPIDSTASVCPFFSAWLLGSRPAYAIANAPGWETERSRAEAWWWRLTSPEIANDIIEFSAGSFWTGHHTYRLMDVGSGWAIARLWKGIGRILPNFRIRELSAVTFASLPTGEMRVTIGSRTMRAFKLVMPELTEANGPIIPKRA